MPSGIFPALTPVPSLPFAGSPTFGLGNKSSTDTIWVIGGVACNAVGGGGNSFMVADPQRMGAA